MVEHGTPRPPSWQVADDLRERIGRGDLKAGQMLPAILSLAQEYGTTTNTIQKALRILKEEGLVQAVPSYGTFVTKRPGASSS